MGPSGFVLATDISSKILEFAAGEARKHGLTNVEWQRMDFGTSDVVTLTTTNSGILTEKLKASHEVDSVMGRLNFKF